MKTHSVSRTIHAERSEGNAPELWALKIGPEVACLATDLASRGRQRPGWARITLTVDYLDGPGETA